MTNVESRLPGSIRSTRGADPLSAAEPSEASAVMGYLTSVAMTAAATVVAVGIDNGMTVPNVSLVFVIPVIIAGISFGLGASLCSALLGALAYNFFLTEPRYSLAVNDPANIWAIGLLLFVGLIVSTIAFTSRRSAAEAALVTRQASVLQRYSRDVETASDTKAIVSVTAKALAALFSVPAAVFIVKEGDVVSVSSAGGLEPQEAEFEAARSSLAMGSVARAGIYPALTSRFDFWPVATADGQSAVIGLAFAPDQRPLSPETSVDIVGRILALALDCQYFRTRRTASPAG